jgi:hypothetical protein
VISTQRFVESAGHKAWRRPLIHVSRKRQRAPAVAASRHQENSSASVRHLTLRFLGMAAPVLERQHEAFPQSPVAPFAHC